MPIGLIILGAVAIFIFFGVTEKLFHRIGIANWVAFLVVMALVGGAIIPSITITDMVSINLSGFVLPIIITVVLLIVIGWGSEMFRALLSIAVVASVVMALRLTLDTSTPNMAMMSGVVIGFVAGTVSYIASRTRLVTIIGALSGIVLADVGIAIVDIFIYNKASVVLGANIIFDSYVIAVVFSLILLEMINGIKKAMARSATATSLSIEAAKDHNLGLINESQEKKPKFVDYFEDVDSLDK